MNTKYVTDTDDTNEPCNAQQEVHMDSRLVGITNTGKFALVAESKEAEAWFQANGYTFGPVVLRDIHDWGWYNNNDSCWT